MTTVKMFYLKVATAVATAFTAFLSMVLFVCANTTSCGMIHQPKAPDQLKAYSKIDRQ